MRGHVGNEPGSTATYQAASWALRWGSTTWWRNRFACGISVDPTNSEGWRHQFRDRMRGYNGARKKPHPDLSLPRSEGLTFVVKQRKARERLVTRDRNFQRKREPCHQNIGRHKNRGSKQVLMLRADSLALVTWIDTRYRETGKL